MQYITFIRSIRSIWYKTRTNLLLVSFIISIFFIFLFLIVGFFTKKDLFTAATVLIATAALLYNIYINKNEKEKEASKFYLEKYIESSEIIRNILESDKSKRRVVWVSAAKIADKMHKLRNKITASADLDFLDVHLRWYMHSILDFLSNKSAFYFYGVDDAQDLDDAAKRCRINDGRVTSGWTPQLDILNINESQIKSILKLIDSVILEEAGYSFFDKDGNLSENVLQINNTSFPGLFRYIADLRSREVVYDNYEGCRILKKKAK